MSRTASALAVGAVMSALIVLMMTVALRFEGALERAKQATGEDRKAVLRLWRFVIGTMGLVFLVAAVVVSMVR